MARFSNNFTQSLANPSYLGGLFTAAENVGSAPGVAAAEAEAKALLEQHNNNPDKLKIIANKYAIENNPLAPLFANAAQAALARQKQNALGGVSYLQNQMQSVLKDPSLSPAEQQNQLNQFQESANAIARGVPGLDPIAVGGLSMKVENSVFQQKEARRQSERADQRLLLTLESFGLQKEQAKIAAERHAEWTNTANYRATMRDLQLAEGQYNQALKLARGLSTVEGGREKFIQAHPDKAGVFDAIAKEQEAKNLQLEELRANAEKNKFDYSEEELMEILQVPTDASEQKIEEAKSAIKTIQGVAKVSPSGANKILENYLSKSITGREIPSAAMAGLFKDAALSYVQTINLRGWDSEEKEEALAAKIALKAADAYVNGAPLDQVMLSFSAAATQVNSEENNVMAALKRDVEEWKASQMQATDSE